MLAKLLTAKTNNTLVQLFRYGLVGGVAFLVDFGCLFVLTEYAGLYYLASAALAFLAGLTTNYFLSVLWVFDKRALDNKFLEYGVFALLGVIGLGLNHCLIYALTEYAGCHYLVSKAVSTAVVLLWNFASRKILLFNRRERPTTAPAGNPSAPPLAAATEPGTVSG